MLPPPPRFKGPVNTVLKVILSYKKVVFQIIYDRIKKNNSMFTINWGCTVDVHCGRTLSDGFDPLYTFQLTITLFSNFLW